MANTLDPVVSFYMSLQFDMTRAAPHFHRVAMVKRRDARLSRNTRLHDYVDSNLSISYIMDEEMEKYEMKIEAHHLNSRVTRNFIHLLYNLMRDENHGQL